MVQIRVGDTYLDLYRFDPPKLNLTIEDITDAAARSYFTKTFRLPATANNSTFFNTAFEINGQDFDVTVKIPAELMIDGNLFTDGELRLNKIYISRENQKIEYECAFFGSVRSLSTSVGEGTLNLLDLSAYNHILTTDTLVNSWQAYPEGGDTDGLLDGNIIYPLVDFGNTYNDDGDVQQGEISNLEGTGREPFTDQNNALDRERFKPWIRAKAVWDKIFEEAGFTYTSDFLTGDIFRNLYISAHGNEASIFTESLSNTAFVSGTGNNDGEEIELTVGGGGYDYGDNMLNGRYIVPQTGSYQFAYQLLGDGQSTVQVNMTLRLRNNTTTLAFVNQVIDAPDPGQDDEFQFNLSSSYIGVLTAGDEINLQFSSNVDLDYQGILTVVDAPGEISISPLLPNDYKQIDFVRDILTKFRLVLSPDKNDSSNFIIEPWVNYIASGDEFDWTDKLDVSKDVEIEPVFYTQKSKIEFNDSEGGDVYNQLYFDQFEEVYGTLRVFNNNELLKGERKVETESIPLLVTQIRGSEEANNGMDNTIIPQLNIHEAEDTGTQFIPVDSKNRYGFYNGIKSTGTVSARDDEWFIEADGGGTTGFTDYPMISSYSSFPVIASTIDFSWQREQGFIKYGLHDEYIGSSVYDVYWNSYLETLYNKWARKVTAYIVLNSQDLVDFSFDDVIFLKDAYYYVEKISDVPLGEKASVKVSLIKLLNR